MKIIRKATRISLGSNPRLDSEIHLVLGKGRHELVWTFNDVNDAEAFVNELLDHMNHIIENES